MLGPEANSPNTQEIESAVWIMLVIGGLLIVAINAVLLAAIRRYRARRDRSPAPVPDWRRIRSMALAALTALALAVFVAGVVFTEKASDVEASGPNGLQATSQLTAQRGLSLPADDSEPLRIRASGQQWVWRYEYPDGTYSYYELVVPVDTTVVVELDSTDVVHRWWVPALSGMFDAVPGTANQTWFRADSEGEFSGQSAAFSGPGYATMRTRVRVVPVTEYESWLEQQAADIADAQEAVAEQVLANEEAGAAAPGGAAVGTGDAAAQGAGGAGGEG